MNIALIDLNHTTVGLRSNTITLGLGVIARFLKNTLGNSLDIRLFKDPAKFTKAIENWKPDVLGISQFCWDSELNLYMAQMVKRLNQGCLVVAGGPNLYVHREDRFEYLKRNNAVDLCVSFDGEIPFTESVSRILNGESIKGIRKAPTRGIYCIDSESGKLVESNEPAPRVDSLDVFGPMYAEGVFDSMLEEGFHPVLQTQRGCPFKCSYCHSGSLFNSKIVFQSSSLFSQDMEYLGRRFAGQHNVILYLANTNFAFFKQDVEIAKIIRSIQVKYDWPKHIHVSSGDNPDKLFEVLSTLKHKYFPVVALQTLTPEVLKNINRRNISFERFVSFQNKMIREIGESTATELIVALPGETKESFLNTISRVLNSGVQNIVIYTLMCLPGAAISSRENEERYGFVIRHRLVPRCFSEIEETKIFETEKVVVGTDAMPFEDYISLRELAFIITVFASSIEMFPIRKFLMDYGLDVAKWIFGIQENISSYPGLYSVYQSFSRETREELFPTREALIGFFSRKENYESLLHGDYGDNLLRKYKTEILSKHYGESLDLAFSQMCELVRVRLDNNTLESISKDLKLFLGSRDIARIFESGYDGSMARNVELTYDIPGWLGEVKREEPLANFKGSFSYSLVITDEMLRRLQTFSQMARDPLVSLQILYRDGYIKDFWPQWVRDEKK